MKTLILILSLGWCNFMLAQTSNLNSTLNLEGGKYSSNQLLNLLEENGIAVNHASGNLNPGVVNFTSGTYSVKTILSKIFDTSRFSFVEKEGKILVIPKVKGNVTVSGYVEDAASRERLIGVNVYIPQLQIGTTTNRYGFYSLTYSSDDDTTTLAASFIGYSAMQYKLASGINHKLDISLPIQNQKLDEVVVIDENQTLSRTQMSQLTLTSRQLKGIPAFFGEEDILKAVQLTPGVQNTSEGNVNYIVRGGSPDQNLILLDGVPVYNASHLFGFFSVFNTDAVKNVQFTKGGFPARYGGRLSSVMEIDMKEGDMKKFHVTGSLGLLSAKLAVEGPIVRDKASFMVSGRRTYLDLLYLGLNRNNDEGAGYFFHDFNAKVNYKFSRKDRMYLSFYTGKDKLFSNYLLNQDKYENALQYGNQTGALRWNRLYNDKLFSNLTATYTRYNLARNNSIKSEFEYDGAEYYSRIEDYGLRYDFDYTKSSNHYIKMGGSYTYHIFKPGAIEYNLADANAQKDSLLAISPFTNSHDAYLYLEDDWTISEKWRLSPGVHYSTYFVESSFYQSLQPRVAARYLLKNDWTLKASYAYMQQYVHLLTNSGAGLPTDLWVSSTDRIAPQKSQQWALSSTKSLVNGMYELTTEIYYKTLTNLITFKDGTMISTSANWQDQVATGGKGEAYGWEVFLQKKRGKTTGWISYALAKSTRQFNDVNEGKVFPYKYDRRHDLKVTVNHSFSEKFNVGANFVLNSGIHATIPIGTFQDPEGNQQVLYSDRNAFQYPLYHRLDLSANWVKKKRWGERTISVGVYNAYNRQNPYYISFETSPTQQRALQNSLFPFMPSFSYSFKF